MAKGIKTPGSGRKKGTPNKATAWIKAQIDMVLDSPEGWQRLAEQFQAGELSVPVLLRLIEYRIGKPKEQIEIDDKRPYRDMTEAAILSRLRELSEHADEVVH